MQITSIEVIRGNPGVAGNAVIGVPAGEKLPVEVGDTVRVHMTVDHRGPRIENAEVYTAIGWQTGVIIPEFIEAYVGRTPGLTFEESLDFVTYEIVCDVPIEPIMMPIEFALYGNSLDIYAKIINVPGPDIFTDSFYYKVIEVVEVPPEYELIQETIYPFSYVYDGDVEVSTFSFKTDPFTPASWVAEKFAKAAADEVEKQGGRLLELRVYVDKTPLLWTEFRIEVIGTPLGGGVAATGIAVGIPIWAAILIAALAIALLIAVITWSIKTIVQLFTHKPLSEEIKGTWSRETLISIIGDFEVKLERTPTPPEELEAMSDQELRDYCNQMAEEIVPPEVAWVPLVIVGALGVLGIGAAIALAAPKR